MVSVPTMLALTGTALMAAAIFAPFRPTVREPKAAVPPRWPTLVEPTATTCEAAARLDLVDALRALDSVWAVQILHAAYDDEPDAGVRAAIAAALASSSQSLVT